ncbi:MAG: T9SS type A sorting domain-containing protein [Flavobacteriales bacterium]|nr:T9SS type A sorting domain-containing protein [Flavobacteriales bacterium]
MKQLIRLSLLAGVLAAHAELAAQSFNWVRPLGGPDADEAYAVAHVSGGGSYVVGMFNGTAQLGATALTSAGGKDMFLARLDGGGNVVWARRAGGSGDQGGHVVATDASGNAIVAGEFEGSMDFSTGMLTASGDRNLYLAKYSDAGLVLWTVQGITSGASQCNSVATDAASNIYVAGRFEGSLQFGATTVTSVGMQDVFVMKLNSAGAVQWLVRAGGADDDDAKGLAMGPDGSVFIAGSFNTIAQFGAITLTAPGASRQLFAAKLSNAGAFQWAKSAGGPGIDQAYEMAADNQGNSYITGFYSGTATFGTFTLTSAGAEDAFVAKLSGTGNFIWVTSVGGMDEDRGYAIEVSPWGNVYVTGSYVGTSTFGSNTFTSAGDKDIFTVALNASGAVAWANTSGGPGFDRGYGITTDGVGGVWVAGMFTGTSNWGPIGHTSAGMADGFVARIGAPVGTDELHTTALQVWPNPTRDRVEVTLPADLPGGTDLVLFNAVGAQLMLQRAVPGARMQVDLQSVPSGLYFLRIGLLATMRVVKE